MIKRWSALKQAVEERFSSAVRGRVELRMASYRKAHDYAGRGYITIDGREVWQAASLAWWPAAHAAETELSSNREIPLVNVPPEDVRAQLREQGMYDQYEWWQGLRRYLGLSIEDALASDELLIRALAFLDRRLGRRPFLAHSPDANDDALVRLCYQFRADAEGWPTSRGAEP